MAPASRESVETATARIGERLSVLRGDKNMRVSELARQTGVSSSMISQIERGHSRPSVGTLFAMARVLGVPVDTFFAEPGQEPAPVAENGAPPANGDDDAGSVPAAHVAVMSGQAAWQGLQETRDVVRRARRASLDIRGGVRWERLTATALDGVEFLELVYSPGAESDQQSYRHPGVELVLVTHGVMTIFLGFEQHDLEPGDSIAFASSTPHRYVNRTAAETRAITVILRDDLSTLEFRDGHDGGAAASAD